MGDTKVINKDNIKRLNKLEEVLMDFENQLLFSYENLKNKNENMEKQLVFDFLSKINEILSKYRIQNYFETNKTHDVILVFLDFNNFKSVSFDYDFGDKILNFLTNKIEEQLDESTKFFRYYAGKFVILFIDKEIDEVKEIVKNLLDNFKEVLIIDGKEVLLTVNAGIYEVKDNTGLNEAIKKAELAVFQSHETDNYELTVFENYMEYEIKRKSILTAKIRKALDDDDFYLVYQPIFDLKTSKIYEVEALSRWYCKDLKENIPPIEFIQLLEETGFIKEFGYLLLEKIFKQIKEWNDVGLKLNVNFNISPMQLMDLGLVEKVKEYSKKYQVEPERIIVEITESRLMECNEIQKQVLNELKKLGFQLAIDDYGNEYSQLTNIIKVPAKEIKIAKEIIGLVDKDDKVKLMVKYLIELFRNLGYIVVAEGVENKEQLQYLREVGCSKIQGYYISKPLEAKMLEEYVKVRNRD